MVEPWDADTAMEDAIEAHRVAVESSIVMALIEMLEWLACPATDPCCWCDHCLAWGIIDASLDAAPGTATAEDDAEALDFSVEAMGHSVASRNRR